MTTDPVPPRVFISWSGESEPIASQLRDLLKLIFGSRLGFWMSRDTNPGERWGDALDRQLENTNFGILCLVPNNLTAPWINYEAGALSKTKTLNSSVVPYCAGFDEGELDQPLSRFQAATAGRDGTFNLVRNMNVLLLPSSKRKASTCFAILHAESPRVQSIHRRFLSEGSDVGRRR